MKFENLCIGNYTNQNRFSRFNKKPFLHRNMVLKRIVVSKSSFESLLLEEFKGQKQNFRKIESQDHSFKSLDKKAVEALHSFWV